MKIDDGAKDSCGSVRDRCAGWSRTSDDRRRRKGRRVMKNVRISTQILIIEVSHITVCFTTPEEEQQGQIAVAGNASAPHVHIYTCNMKGTLCQHHKFHLTTTVMKNRSQLLIRLCCFSVSRPEAGEAEETVIFLPVEG